MKPEHTHETKSKNPEEIERKRKSLEFLENCINYIDNASEEELAMFRKIYEANCNKK